MDVIGSVLVVAVAFLSVTAAIGLQRFDDVLARMHSATKPATLGLIFVVVGSGLMIRETGAVAKLLLVVLLQVVTAPVGAHLLGRAVVRSGEASPDTVYDPDIEDMRPPDEEH
ncbi:MAG TPA: monovalent cation/H(+) antiporter subunit G [Acidimicrobiia bacterium]|nr:monovalent cation/H(+) antiporter subunit G [Acidimicrobiia bacterium]